ncbi:MerR family transcriptional regulator [Dyella sp. SG609]|uniref:MerR family transcriptional regulator n=1 Tax=Dyella sp. SG609 TaxID=2587018 RepID=UPI001447FBC0|nr:MerR family transcriptional regulator [Dyella sp. SG609]NKJ23153.1 DNA-binding transcriptional MerR regulator [Dyella sp. SG609]
MLIAEFCRRAGLTRDAVRLYVKLGLIRPSAGASGSNRYQQFHEADVDRVALIKVGQQLGFTLKQIVILNEEYEAGGIDQARRLAVMQAQLAQVDEKATQLGKLQSYLRAKIAWIEAGEHGDEPSFCGLEVVNRMVGGKRTRLA